MQDLAGATGQSAFVACLFGAEVRSVNCLAPDTAVRFHIVAGAGMPPHASATATSILAFAPPETLEAALAVERTAFAPRSIADRARLNEEPAQTRARGHSIEHGEHFLGLASVARPIPRAQGEVRLVLGLTGPEGASSARKWSATLPPRPPRGTSWRRCCRFRCPDGLSQGQARPSSQRSQRLR